MDVNIRILEDMVVFVSCGRERCDVSNTDVLL